MIKKVWKWIKDLFTKNDNSKNRSTKQQGIKKTSKASDGSSIIDNSHNTTTNTHIEKQENYYATVDSKDANFGLIVTARWMGRVPHKIIETTGFDKLNVLTPTEANYVRPHITIKTDESQIDADDMSKLHVLVEPNSKTIIYNLKITRIKFDLQTLKEEINNDIGIVAAVKEKYAFLLQSSDLRIEEGIIVIDFSFESANNTYRQAFEFEANKQAKICTEGNFFSQKKYSNPVLMRAGANGK